jgi:hypothetical protein
MKTIFYRVLFQEQEIESTWECEEFDFMQLKYHIQGASPQAELLHYHTVGEPCSECGI